MIIACNHFFQRWKKENPVKVKKRGAKEIQTLFEKIVTEIEFLSFHDRMQKSQFSPRDQP